MSVNIGSLISTSFLAISFVHKSSYLTLQLSSSSLLEAGTALFTIDPPTLNDDVSIEAPLVETAESNVTPMAVAIDTLQLHDIPRIVFETTDNLPLFRDSDSDLSGHVTPETSTSIVACLRSAVSSGVILSQIDQSSARLAQLHEQRRQIEHLLNRPSGVY